MRQTLTIENVLLSIVKQHTPHTLHSYLYLFKYCKAVEQTRPVHLLNPSVNLIKNAIKSSNCHHWAIYSYVYIFSLFVSISFQNFLFFTFFFFKYLHWKCAEEKVGGLMSYNCKKYVFFFHSSRWIWPVITHEEHFIDLAWMNSKLSVGSHNHCHCVGRVLHTSMPRAAEMCQPFSL